MPEENKAFSCSFQTVNILLPVLLPTFCISGPVFFFFFKCLFLAVLSLCCCAQAFSGCSEWGLLFSCGVQASHCGGFSCCRAHALDTWASVVVAQALSCSSACGIFPDQGSNPCPLHWQADSYPLYHLGSHIPIFIHLLADLLRGSHGQMFIAHHRNAFLYCNPSGSSVHGILQARILV